MKINISQIQYSPAQSSPQEETGLHRYVLVPLVSTMYLRKDDQVLHADLFTGTLIPWVPI